MAKRVAAGDLSTPMREHSVAEVVELGRALS